MREAVYSRIFKDFAAFLNDFEAVKSFLIKVKQSMRPLHEIVLCRVVSTYKFLDLNWVNANFNLSDIIQVGHFFKKCSSSPVIIVVNKVIPEIFIIITIITSSSSLLVTSGNSVVNRVIAEIVVHLSKPATEGKNGPNGFMLTLLRFNDNDDGHDNECKYNYNSCRHRQSAWLLS